MDLKNKFLIGGWQAPPPTVKNYKTLVQCGLNTIFLNGDYTKSDNLVKKGVKAAEKTGVSVILEGRNDLRSPILFKNPFKEYDCIIGVNVYDEPTYDQINDVLRVSKDVKKAYPDKAFYINLLPSYSPPQSINSHFIDYIENYAKIISETEKNGWLSFDYYPLEITEEGEYRLGPTWLNDVETMSKTAKKYDLKPHFFIQSMAYGGTISHFHDRQPSVEDFRLQIYVYLAYGAKGFTHFCYQSPVSPEFSEHQTGLILNEKKTDRWYLAKKVHKEIFAFLDEYTAMSWQGVVKVYGKHGNKTAFDGLDDFDFSESKYIKSVKSDENVIVGVLKGENKKEGYVLVNFADTTGNVKAKVTLRLKESANVSVYKKGKNKTGAVLKQTSVTLKKGEGVFITANGK